MWLEQHPPHLAFGSLESFDSDRILSQRLDDHTIGLVIATATDADKARLPSTSALHAASWLSVVPSVGLGLHLDPNELQIAVKWWLGLDISRGSSCALCPDVALDPLGHHAATCRRGGDVVIRHNRLRDVFLSFCHQAHIAARLEAGSGSLTAVETYGAWGDEAQCRLASLLSVGSALPKGKVLSDIYGHLNFKLMHATARALLARSPPILTQLDSG
eukprot:Em0001g3184a